MLLISLLSGLIPLFLVQTTIIKVMFVIVTPILVFLSLHNLSRGDVQVRLLSWRFEHNYYLWSRAIVLLLGITASFCVLLISGQNFSIYLGPSGVLESFLSLSPLSATRVLSAYFLSGFFPGLIIYFSFLNKERLDNVEKIGLILAFSFCYTFLSGLVLTFFGAFSISSYLLLLWFFVLVTAFGRKLLRIRNEEIDSKSQEQKPHFLAVNLTKLTPIIIGVFTVALGYLIVSSGVNPRVDIISTINYGSEFINYDVSQTFIRSNQVAMGVYLWITTALTGLPTWYTFVGIQFYVFLFPAAFYMLVRSIFPNHREIAATATVLAFLGAGLGLLPAFFASQSPDYIFGSTLSQYNSLLAIYQKTGSGPWLYLLAEEEAFDSFIFFALAFSYRYLIDKRQHIGFIFASSILVSCALLNHNVFFFPIFLFPILIFSIAVGASYKRLGALLGSIIALTLLLDLLSKFVLGNVYLGILFGQEAPGTSTNLLPVLVPIILFLICGALLIISKRKWIPPLVTLGLRLKFFFGKSLSTMHSHNKVKTIFPLMGFLIFFYLVFLLLNEGMPVQGWLDGFTPWYYFITIWGFTLPLAISAIIYIKRIPRNTLAFLLGLLISLCIIVLLSFKYPNVLNSIIWAFRYRALLVFPFSILASFFLFRFVSNLKFGAKRFFVYVLIIIMLSSSFLSSAYLVESSYLPGQLSNRISSDEANSIEFINENLHGNLILPLSYRGEALLTNFGKNVKVLPVFRERSPILFPYPWVRDLLINLTCSDTLYILHELGVDYIFKFNEENVIVPGLSSFPVVYENSLVKIFSVPKYFFYENSNYNLVNTLAAGPTNFEDAFNLMMFLKSNVSLEQDLTLEDLDAGNVYFFPDSIHIPEQISNTLLNKVRDGAHVVFLNPQFATLDQIGRPTSLNFTQSQQVGISANLTSLENLSIVAGEGNLTFDEAGGLYAENGKPDPYGSFYYQYTFSDSLNFEDQGYIKVTFKTSAPGNFTFVLMSTDLSRWWAWKGSVDERYSKLIDTPSDMNVWKTVILPIREPTWNQSGFNISDVKAFRVALDNVSLDANVTFQIRAVEFLPSCSTINFADGNRFTFDGIIPERQVVPLYQGQVIANYSFSNGDTSPLVWYSALGNGSLTFIDLEPLQNLDINCRRSVLQYIAATIKKLFPPATSSDEQYSLPYPPDMFRYIVPHPENLRFMQGLQNTVLWYDTINVAGNVTVRSDEAFLSEQCFRVKDFIIETNTGKLVFSNTTINNLMIEGGINIYSTNSEIEILAKPLALYSDLNLIQFYSCNIRIDNAELKFELETEGKSELYSLHEVNVTFTPAEDFTFLAKQPTLTIAGTVAGLAQGTFRYDYFYYTSKEEYINITGAFTMESVYSSGIIYSKMTRIIEINDTKGFDRENLLFG